MGDRAMQERPRRSQARTHCAWLALDWSLSMPRRTPLLGQRREVLGQAIEAHGDAFLHPGLERCVARRLRRVAYPACDRRLAVRLGEGQRVERFGPGAAPRLG